MKVKRLPEAVVIAEPASIKCETAGNITRFVEMQKKPPLCPVLRVDSEHYVDTRDGQIGLYRHSETKEQCDARSIYKSLATLRGIINANCENDEYLRWVTLTYRENMQDSKRLSKDFDVFWKRFRRYCSSENWKVPEYITVAEPQGRGAWHLHLLMIFNGVAPFIPNEQIALFWGQGFTKTKPVHGVDNIGAYFSAYLADIPIEDAEKAGIVFDSATVLEKNVDEDGNTVKQSKRFVKGARLSLYPAGMNFFRCSRGVKRPVVEDLSTLTYEEVAEKKASAGTLTFSQSCSLVDEDGKDCNTLTVSYYNRKRQKSQEECADLSDKKQ